jgi:hypothetical protein
MQERRIAPAKLWQGRGLEHSPRETPQEDGSSETGNEYSRHKWAQSIRMSWDTKSDGLNCVWWNRFQCRRINNWIIAHWWWSWTLALWNATWAEGREEHSPAPMYLNSAAGSCTKCNFRGANLKPCTAESKMEVRMTKIIELTVNSGMNPDHEWGFVAWIKVGGEKGVTGMRRGRWTFAVVLTVNFDGLCCC